LDRPPALYFYIEVYSHHIVYTLVLKYEKTIGIHMQKFMGDSRGVSVVIGAIMLTLIVVTAATTYAIFVSEQQKKIQDAETSKLQRQLENVTILSLENPTYNSPTLDSVSFVIANLNNEQAIITSMNINNRFIRQFTFERVDGVEEWNQSSGKFQIGCLFSNDTAGLSTAYLFFDKNNNQRYDNGDEVIDYDYDNDGNDATPKTNDRGGLLAYNNSTLEPFIFQDLNNNKKYDNNVIDRIFQWDPDNNSINASATNNSVGHRIFGDYTKRPTIHPREQIILIINNTQTDTFGMKDITKNDSITLHIFTSRTNDFFKTFYPPTAIITIETDAVYNRSSGNFDEIIILDGSSSDHPGSGSITRWEWNITTNNSGTIEYDLNKTGRKIRANFISPNLYHTIMLTITDSYGMIATDTLEYYY